MTTILPFFLKYLLAPILILIITFIMGQFSAIKVKVKSAIIFVLCFSLIIILISPLAFFNNEFIWFGLIFTILYFLFIGILLLRFMKTNYFQGIGIADSILGKVFVFLIVTVFSCWLYYLIFNLIAITGYAHIIMLNILWVFIPFLFAELKQKYIVIPEPFYAYWQVGIDKKDNEYWDNIDKFHLMQVSIKIKKRENSEFFSKFDVKIAQQVKLGSWFNKFIEDQNYRFPNDPIDTNEKDEKLGWIFYVPRYFNMLLFIRNLDPDVPISQSKIKNKQIIYAKRVSVNFQGLDSEDKENENENENDVNSITNNKEEI
jgi:hypothetical protein